MLIGLVVASQHCAWWDGMLINVSNHHLSPTWTRLISPTSFDLNMKLSIAPRSKLRMHRPATAG
jgi:hypothetical protein